MVFGGRVLGSGEVYSESVFVVKFAFRGFWVPLDRGIVGESGRGRVDEGVGAGDA